MRNTGAILIVDDRSDNLVALERVLGPLGVDIVRALSGEGALKAALNRDFAVAILDVQMPGMDGYELARLLRGSREARAIPIIFLSAVFSDQAHIFMGYESGAVDFITKPFIPEILLSKVRVFLELDRGRRDILRHVEEQRRINDLLKGEIAEREAAQEACKIARVEAEQANQAKSDFLANMSHEIRTPMNGVLGMADLALSTTAEPQTREYLGFIKQSGQALLHIINDILDFSKIKSGRLELNIAPLNLEDLLDTYLKPLRYAAEAKALTLEWTVEPTVPGTLLGDSVRLGQILTNLVGNAVKFTEHGRVTVRAGLAEPKPAALSGETRLLFTVADTGIGIALDRQVQIFDSFSQADVDSHFKYGGTGLGLAIAKELAKVMGGQIGVESALGQGSQFFFTVRLRTPVSVSPNPPVPSQDQGQCLSKAMAGLRILLAEDNKINQLLAKALLEQRGHEVHMAENGRAALDKLSAQRFDCVIMDIRMPVMGGVEATMAIRRGEVAGLDPNIPIVAVTAHAMKGDRERFLAAGMDEHIPKPLCQEDLDRALGLIQAKLRDRGQQC
jgi:two-component system CheB/CheR fusion protein